MKAVCWQGYGGPEVLTLGDIAPPRPGARQVLIKVHAATVTAGDARLRAMDVAPGFGLPTRLAFGLTKPRRRTPGMEFAGEVAEIGRGVSRFRVGEQVFGTAGMALGAHAEYLCVDETAVICRTPANLSHQQAVAAIFGGLTAIQFLQHKVSLHPGQRLLINGASGAVGTSAIQLAKAAGAWVCGVCSSANTELVRALGADEVLNYDTASSGNAPLLHTAKLYPVDFILDAVGNLTPKSCAHLLGSTGKLIQLNTGLMGNLWAAINPRLIAGVAAESEADLQLLKTLLGSGKLVPVIDSVYSLADIASAHRRVDSHRKKGSVVIAVQGQ
ncbi:NAD(P)-dependent alcohol dehydrogenase [Shewanella khirikhana]|uniref:Quinone oxidoreductase 1 n=1 Tax=Shewanella khirikhana TaxID=1965282 RepID=A0ABM7D247_9GAMM|nr:NAD(P)-dependent alcohol dehydrogenase [Shewanella khirikhana]AZQ10431.1 Quinone oxidoreductase 1 [Shewanella khirikhana]